VVFIDVQFAAISVDECAGEGRAELRRVDAVVSLHIVQDLKSQTAAVGCTGVVEIENLRDFVRGSGAAVEAARYINGGGFDSVAIATAEHFLLGYVFVNNESVVNEDFRDARVLRHGADVHELIIQRFLSVRYRLPFGPFSDFAHLVRRFSGVQDLASERRFLKQRVHWISASSGVGGVFVVGAVKTPFGAKIEGVFAYLATLLVCASGEAVVHGDQHRVAQGASVVVVDALDFGLGRFIVEDFPDFGLDLVRYLTLFFLCF